MKITALLIFVLCLSGCGIIPKEVDRLSLDPHRAYIAQFVDKRSSFSFEYCHALYFDKIDSKNKSKRVKIDGHIYDILPAGDRKLMVGVSFSSPTLFRGPGLVMVELPARLKEGTYYDFNFRRIGEKFTISLKEFGTSTTVSPEVTFDAVYPDIVPIPIPL